MKRTRLLLLLVALMAIPLGCAWFLGLPVVFAAYLLASLLTYGLYRYDKRQAREGRWRVPEKLLHMAAFYGGWPGALVAQQRLRHKTRKVRFLVAYWGIVLLHQLFWSYWLLPAAYQLLH